MGGQEQIVPVLGPLSTSLEGVKLFMKTVIGGKPWLKEPSLVPIPWRDQESYFATDSRKRLKVGVMWDDGVVKPHPPVLRAIQEVVNKLKEIQSVEIVEWKPCKHDEAWSIISNLYFGDGGQEEIAAIEASGEPWRPLSKFILKDNPSVKKLTVEEIWQWTVKREKYKTEYAKIWNDTSTGTSETGELEGMVDVILCPVGPGAAPPLDCARYWGYTAQWNLLDYPALVFPVTKVDLTKDVIDQGYTPMNEKDEYNHGLWKSGPEKYKGAPISLQLVGRRYDDEKVG